MPKDARPKPCPPPHPTEIDSNKKTFLMSNPNRCHVTSPGRLSKERGLTRSQRVLTLKLLIPVQTASPATLSTKPRRLASKTLSTLSHPIPHPRLPARHPIPRHVRPLPCSPPFFRSKTTGPCRRWPHTFLLPHAPLR